MKRFLTALLLCTAVLCPKALADASSPPQISAKAAIVICADDGKAVFELNADDRMLIASTTKIMTAVVALESCGLDERVRIDSRSAGTEGSSMYLREGDVLTVEELLYGLMLCSGNDAASALAIHAAGSAEEFARLMNAKAKELGLEGTHFANPHGLDAEGHYSTAGDMARLAAYAMQNQDFARIVSTKSAVIQGREIQNHNRLLFEYPGCIGIKTGYTMAAGRTLVSCAQRGDTRFICVTLCDRDDWRDHEALYDWAFENYEYRKVIDSAVCYRVSAVNGGAPYVRAQAENDRGVLLEKGEEAELEIELPPFVIAPVTNGEAAGVIRAVSGGETLCEVRLVYTQALPAEERSGLLARAAEWLRGLGKPIYLTEE